MRRITGLLRLCLPAFGVAFPPSFALAHPDHGEHVHGATAGFAQPFGGLDHPLAMVGVGHRRFGGADAAELRGAVCGLGREAMAVVQVGRRLHPATLARLPLPGRPPLA